MVSLPPEFVATRYPGYFWSVKQQHLFSIKSGVLKPLRMHSASYVGNAYNQRGWARIDGDYRGWTVSVEGRSRRLYLSDLLKLKPAASKISVQGSFF